MCANSDGSAAQREREREKIKTTFFSAWIQEIPPSSEDLSVPDGCWRRQGILFLRNASPDGLPLLPAHGAEWVQRVMGSVHELERGKG